MDSYEMKMVVGNEVEQMEKKRDNNADDLWLDDIVDGGKFRCLQEYSPSTSSADSEDSCSSQVFNSQSSVCHQRKVKKLVHKKFSKQRHLGQYKSLASIDERKRLRRITASKLRRAKCTANAVDWREKIDREFEPLNIEARRRIERLKEEFDSLVAERQEAAIRLENMQQEARRLRVLAAARQEVELRTMIAFTQSQIEWQENEEEAYCVFFPNEANEEL